MQTVDDEEVARRARARKDRTRWCGGHVGREHDPQIVIPPNHPGWAGRCGPPPEWFKDTPRYRRMAVKPTWWCVHRVVCARCERVLRRTVRDRDCPDQDVSDV